MSGATLCRPQASKLRIPLINLLSNQAVKQPTRGHQMNHFRRVLALALFVPSLASANELTRIYQLAVDNARASLASAEADHRRAKADHERYLALRGSGIGFVMITLAIGQIVWGVAYRWISITNGDNGISVSGRPTVLGLSLASPAHFYWATLAVFLAALASSAILVASPFGASLRGTRDQPRRMAALGYHVWMVRFLAFLLSGLWSGVAGLRPVRSGPGRTGGLPARRSSAGRRHRRGRRARARSRRRRRPGARPCRPGEGWSAAPARARHRARRRAGPRRSRVPSSAPLPPGRSLRPAPGQETVPGVDVAGTVWRRGRRRSR